MLIGVTFVVFIMTIITLMIHSSNILDNILCLSNIDETHRLTDVEWIRIVSIIYSSVIIIINFKSELPTENISVYSFLVLISQVMYIVSGIFLNIYTRTQLPFTRSKDYVSFHVLQRFKNRS